MKWYIIIVTFIWAAGMGWRFGVMKEWSRDYPLSVGSIPR